MKKKVFYSELQGLTLVDLKEKRRSLSEELMKTRFRKNSSQLETTHRIKELKRQVAQAMTLLEQKQA